MTHESYTSVSLDNHIPQWGTADTEIKVSSAENTELSKPAVGQIIALYASPKRNSF